MIQAPSQCTREAGRKMGSSSRRRRRLLCTCSCNLKWHFAIVMAHASYVLFLLSVPARAAVISNGNYTRHFRRNWDLFRSLGTLRGAVTRCNGYLRRPTRVTRRTASNAKMGLRLRESPDHSERMPPQHVVINNYYVPATHYLLSSFSAHAHATSLSRIQ